MRFTLEQLLPGSVDDVISALLDPEFLRCLGDLPNLAPPEVLDQQRDGDRVVQRIRYRFTGSVSSAVARVVDPKKITWVDETTYDLTSRRASFRVIPDHYASKLRCAGSYEFTERDGSTVRHADGELTVSVPFVGKVVERAIVSGLTEHITAEADLLQEWLEPSG